MTDPTELQAALEQAADAIAAAGRRMDRFGWTASFGGNLSLRLAGDRIAITRSGCRKGLLRREDVIAVDGEGRALVPGDRPSDETRLHCQIYAALPTVGAVIHGHTVAATVLSRTTAGAFLCFTGYEMNKAFRTLATHDATLRVPLLDNHQDMEALRSLAAPLLRPETVAYVLRGHGAYVWGASMDEAMANFEALEFLLGCELEHRRIAGA